eukprot:scaffold40_cov413-Prasinococcus_capsulatus_cf.AAC.14
MELPLRPSAVQPVPYLLCRCRRLSRTQNKSLYLKLLHSCNRQVLVSRVHSNQRPRGGLNSMRRTLEYSKQCRTHLDSRHRCVCTDRRLVAHSASRGLGVAHVSPGCTTGKCFRLVSARAGYQGHRAAGLLPSDT